MRKSSRAAHSSPQRCPGCGQLISAPIPQRCHLCGFDFRDDRVTGTDVTPFAKAYSMGAPGWWRMSEWMWFASGGRLKHLALMRASAASRRYALLTTLLLMVGIGLCESTRVGWRWVTPSPDLEPTGSTDPSGEGWIRVVGAARPLPPDQPIAEAVDLWWNFPQAVIAVLSAGLTGLLGMWLVLFLIRVGTRRSLIKPHRGEGRTTAAIHYGTAWWIPLFLAAVVVWFRPIGFVGTMAGWRLCPSDRGFVLAAAVPAGFGLIMWWVWLWRLVATIPARMRGLVVVFFVIGVPLIVSAVVTVWWWALPRLYDPLFRAINVQF